MGVVVIDEFDEEFRAAYESRDAVRITELYEPDAVLVQPGVDGPIIGRDAIESSMRETFEFLSDISLHFDEPVVRQVVGDLAWGHGSSTTEFSLPDGSRHTAITRSTTVLRRGADGSWRLALDHAS